MAFYDDLTQATEAERNALLSIPLIQLGAAGQLSLESYLAFLGQAYHHVKHTIPLLMATAGACPSGWSGCAWPLVNTLKRRWAIRSGS